MALTQEGGRLKWERNFPGWLEKCSQRHNGQYLYPSMERVDVGGAWKVRIVCPEHGEFLQAPEKHAFGQGCPSCVGFGLNKLDKLNLLFPDFDFGDLAIPSSKTMFTLYCPEHGEFLTSYNRLTTKSGRGVTSPCPKCNKTSGGLSRRKRVGVWSEQVSSLFGGKVTVLEGSITVASDKADFECSLHGQFRSTLQDVVTGHGCPECGQLKRNSSNSLDATEFLKIARAVHGDRYEYDLTDFTNTKTAIPITCAKHGVFHQRPNNHISNGAGCPACATSVSLGEQALRDWLASAGVDVVPRNRDALGGKEIDIYLPAYRLGVEYCGLYWHGEDRKDSQYHKEKLELAEAAGIRLVTVFEDEWLNPDRRNMVMLRLLGMLGASRKIHARKTEVRTLPWTEARDFLDMYHMQGAGVPAKVCYGLFLGDDLVSVTTWGLSRFNKDVEWELLRFASSGANRVIGGLSKMFSAFVKGVSPKSVLSYADRRWGTGEAYRKIGFVFDGVTAPGYFWCKGSERYSRHHFQKHRLESVLKHFDPAASEAENCRANGYWRIYDCGHSRWVWRAA